MQFMAFRAKRVLSVGCLAALLLTIPLAATTYAADKDDRPANASRRVVVPRYYYAYPVRPHWGWGWGPRFWDPYWNYPGNYYYEPDTTGKVKIHDSVKTDEVYVNGAFAGTSHDLKTMKLDPGKYQIEIRRDGREMVKMDVYVATGKTVKIDVDKAA